MNAWLYDDEEADCLNVGVDPPGQVRITLEWVPWLIRLSVPSARDN